MDFGITPQQLAQVVARWRHCGTQIADLAPEVGDLPVSGSAAAQALNTCLRTTRAVTTGRATQLHALADALDRFGALTVEADAAAAAALAERRRS
ncbi:hypothetical protein [Gordonia hydrophobica]|uniref:ESX-1 secretion-associated protein n=1 Tax=Gordonia hydrophobica TaxID=40516 RepID=A0ABZ2U2Z6_9ACTN|nr:hypothetical protein [Gordonia hydrophobica]MBM7367335.1 hypothetical protein [Gordonia hydrophobica]